MQTSAVRRFHLIQRLLILLIFAGAAWLLYRELRRYSLSDIRDGLDLLPRKNIGWAAALTVLNYIILVGYDWLAVRSIGHPLALRRIALASFCGHAASYNFGALLGGSSIRCRFYAAWGLSAVEIVRLLAMLGITFWLGGFALAGVVFAIDPPESPSGFQLPFGSSRILGGILILIVVLYLLIGVVRKAPIVLRGHQLALPSLRISLLQITIAAADLIVAAGVLYTVLPPGLEISFAKFVGIYLLGVVVVLFAHVPGGVGVFEIVVLKLLESGNPQNVIASLLVFRVLYYIVPLIVAALLLGAFELSVALYRKRRPSSAPP